MTTTDCPPLSERITKSLLGYGVIAGPVYIVVAVAQMLIRDGFDPSRHSVSQLANGHMGWIQVVSFLLVGAMVTAGAVGVGRALPPGRLARWSALLLGGYGIGLFAAGLLRADPSDGFPPGTPPGVGAITWHGIGHLIAAALGFACLIAAGFVIGAAFSRAGSAVWARLSWLTAAVFAASFMWLSSGTGGAAAILMFTAAVVASWAWLSAISVTLYRNSASR